MPIKVTLEPAATDLLLQGDTEATLTVTNIGDATVRVPNPDMNQDIPAFRVVEAKTGIEFYRRLEAPAQGPILVELPPGKSLSKRFSLMPGLHLHVPGEFLVHARYFYNSGLSVAESEPVKITLRPITPRSLSTVYVQGGFSFVKCGVSINAISDPPRLVRHVFSIMSEGGASNAQEIGVCEAIDVPDISAPPNRSVSYEHWITVRRGGKFLFHHVNAAGEATKPVAFDPPPNTILVTPTSITPSEVDTARGAGRALIWSPVPGRGGTFTTLALNPDARPAPGPSMETTARTLLWCMAAERTPSATIPHVVVYAQPADSGRFALMSAPWPDRAPGGAVARPVGEITGELLGSDLFLDAEETIHGASLVLSEPRKSRALRLVRWRVYPDGRGEVGPEHGIPWPYSHPILKVLVRVGPGGVPAALIAGTDGMWSMFEPLAGLIKLPAAVGPVGPAIDLGFQAESSPVIICGRQAIGYDIIQPDGRPLPHFCG